MIRCHIVLAVVAAAALSLAAPASAQSFRSGYRASFVSGNYFGPHRPYQRYRSGHIGYLDYSPHTYGTYSSYRPSGYRRHGSFSESYSYRSSFQSGYGYGNRYVPHRSYCSPYRSFGYSSGYATTYYRSRGYGSYGSYGYGRAYHGYPSGRYHDSRTSYRGAYTPPRGVYVLDGNAAWRATRVTPYPAVRPRETPWRARMEAAYDHAEAAAERDRDVDRFLRTRGPVRSPDRERRVGEGQQPNPSSDPKESELPQPPVPAAPKLEPTPREPTPTFDPAMVSAGEHRDGSPNRRAPEETATVRATPQTIRSASGDE